MTTLREVEALIAQLSRAEKAQLLQAVVRDLGDAFPGIASTPEVSGGCGLRERLHDRLRAVEVAVLAAPRGAGHAVGDEPGDELLRLVGPHEA